MCSRAQNRCFAVSVRALPVTDRTVTEQDGRRTDRNAAREISLGNFLNKSIAKEEYQKSKIAKNTNAPSGQKMDGALESI